MEDKNFYFILNKNLYFGPMIYAWENMKYMAVVLQLVLVNFNTFNKMCNVNSFTLCKLKTI